MALDAVKNFVKVEVLQGNDASATTIALATGQGAELPDPAVLNYNLVWWDSSVYPDPADDPNVEVIRVTGKSGDNLTITRAQEGTSASTKNTVGSTYKLILGMTAKMVSDIETLLNSKKVFHGIQSFGALSYDNTSHVLTVASGSNTYWYKGTKYTTAAAITCDLDLTADRDNSSNTLTANKLYYLYFKDATGKLYWSDSPWNFKENVFVCTVFWNGSAGAVQDERHNHTRDLDFHIYMHDTRGVAYESGSTLTNPTTVNDALLQIETGTYHDEDLDFATGQCTTMRGWRKNASTVFTFADYSLPYLGTSGQPQFVRTSDYTLQNVGANDYVCMWVYAANDIGRKIYIIPTTAAAAHGTIAQARLETPPNLGGLNFNPDMKLIYRFIYKGDGNFQESADYRATSPLPSGGTPSTTAGAVTFSPAGTISSTSVQGALEELDLDIQSFVGLFDINMDGDLEPVTAVQGDAHYELDVNDDIQPKV